MKAIRKILLIALLAALGGVVGFLSARYGLKLPHPPGWAVGHKLALLALLPVAALLAIGLHELGHVLAGRALGFRFVWLTVGPFKWKQMPAGLKFEWNTSLNTAGGLALCVPPDDHDLRRRFSWYALGGPLGSLAWAALALGGFALLPAGGSPAAHVPLLALAVSGLLSALLFVVTLIPMHTGGFTSDGGRVLSLARGGPAGQLELAVLAAMVRSMAGTRPRELSRPALEAALRAVAPLPTPPPFQKYAHYYLYLSLLDAGDPAAAAPHLAAYQAGAPDLPPAFQGSVWLEAAFFAAAYQHDAAAAEAFQRQAKPSPLTPADVPPRVAAALARLAGDAALARAQAQAALRELPQSLDPGSARFYADWLQDTLRWADAAETQQTQQAQQAQQASMSEVPNEAVRRSV